MEAGGEVIQLTKSQVNDRQVAVDSRNVILLFIGLFARRYSFL